MQLFVMKLKHRQLTSFPSVGRASLGGVLISNKLVKEKAVQKLKEKFDAHAMEKQRSPTHYSTDCVLVHPWCSGELF